MNKVMRPLHSQAAEPFASMQLGKDLVGFAENGEGPSQTSEHAGLLLHWVGESPAPIEVRPGRLRLKRAMDLILALAFLLVLGPLMLFLAAGVLISGEGPILFRQQREGLHGKLFWALKFRSMQHSCADPSGLRQATRNDPRLTPFGAFMRRTSLDELPQLFNVVRGEMALVGPRPHVPGMLAAGMPYRELVHFYEQRLAMLPGITGWAQAHGWRGPMHDPVAAWTRVEFDLAYGQNFSVLLDLRILFLTVRNQFLSGTGH